MSTATFGSVDDLLSDARARIARLAPVDAAARVAVGALIVDIRPAWQRAADGEVPGSVVVDGNHVLWRLHPGSGASLPQARDDQEWIVLCTEGYTSSLAAAQLASLGVRVSDVIGGVRAWAAAGLPIADSVTPVETVVTAEPSRQAGDA